MQEASQKISQQVLWICCDPFMPAVLNPKKKKELTIGRLKSADIHLPHTSVSRVHAKVRSISERCFILEDMNSSNGTFINGKKVDSYPIQVGDIVQIGPYELSIQSQPFQRDSPYYGATNTDFLTTSRAAAMAGQIEKTSLVEVLQNIEFHEKTGTLYVESRTEDGFLTFVSGKPVAARFGGVKDIPAILAMLNLNKGNFILTDKFEPMAMAINTTMTNILLEYSRLQDESDDFFQIAD